MTKKQLIILLLVLSMIFLFITGKQQVYLQKENPKDNPGDNPNEKIAIKYQQTNSSINFINWFNQIPVIDMRADVFSVKTRPTKKSYTIAVFGDSMIQTMGEGLPYLNKSLKEKYPKTDFYLYNFGVGSQNIIQGLGRFDNDFNNFTPDIIILGSFAYNPMFPYDTEEYRKDLILLVEKAKKITPNVYLLAEIAPLKNDFGRAKYGINWPASESCAHAAKIINNLETVILTANENQIHLIDVFSKSITNSQKEGNKIYVSNYDGIHPSTLGQQLTSKIISEIINLN